MRKEPLTTNEVYHIFNRSIAEFKIFNSKPAFLRIIESMRYYQTAKPEVKFSRFQSLPYTKKTQKAKEEPPAKSHKLVHIIAYCIMPTHIHFILKQAKEKGISVFMNNLLNSHSRYFNIKHNRKGPLWEGRFKNVLVTTDEQLLHLTRYIHLNPVTAGLAKTPQDWFASSYGEYIATGDDKNRICNFNEMMQIDPLDYRHFVEDQISYQKELALIRKLTLDG